MKAVSTAFAILLVPFTCLALGIDSVPSTDADWDTLLDAISLVESGGRDDVSITDVNGRKSVGRLQIQQSYLSDSRLGYTLDEMKEKVKAYEVAKAYLKRYGEAYTRKTGRAATAGVLARIHNGGPNGWRLESTAAYRDKVKGRLG